MQDFEPKSNLSRITCWLAIGVLSVLALAWIGIPIIYCPPESAAEFGDMFGGVNALFSGFAFLGVIVAILLQREELSLQRQELRDTRDELRGQKEQLEMQNTTFKRQAFESAFFQMISLHHEIVNALSTYSNTMDREAYCGRECFDYYFSSYYSLKFSTHLPFGKPFERGAELQRQKTMTHNAIKTVYSYYYQESQKTFSHYLGNFHQILRFVDRSIVDNKRFYIDLLRAQLSESEVNFLLLCALSTGVQPELKLLIERYSFFEGHPIKGFPFLSLGQFFERSAFDETCAQPVEPEASN